MDLNISPIILCSIFVLSVAFAGIFLRRRSLLHILISIELVFVSVNLNFVHFWLYTERISSAINILLILGITAVEVAVALAIIMKCFHGGALVTLDNMSLLKE